MKNTQTNDFLMREDRQHFKKKLFYNLINHTKSERPVTISNARYRYVSDFYEAAYKNHHHFSPEYSKNVEKFPILFGKTQGEFGEIVNAIPSTNLIIKTDRKSFS